VLDIHPLAQLFPPMSQEEFLNLKEDILANGLNHPITLLESKILDGVHRAKACAELGLEVPSVEYRGDNPTAYVLSQNLHRRHLNTSQRAMIASELATMEKGRPEENAGIPAFSQQEAAAQLGVSRDSVQQARQVQREAAPEVVEQVKAGEMTVHAAQQTIEKKPHVAHNRGVSEHFTPPEYIKAARKMMGTIDLDPASCLVANQHLVKASQFYDQETDGLTQDWHGNVWLNPPYSFPLVEAFLQKLVVEFKAHRVQQAIVLVNNATDTNWFQDVLSESLVLCLPHGRIRFWVEASEGVQPGPSTPLQGQAILYLGPHIKAFKGHFNQFGCCLMRMV